MAEDWLTAHPVAHRGLHDAGAGIIENTASAFQAAVAGGYAIECDVQGSADGEAMVHHDFNLGRVTNGNGGLAEHSARDLAAVPFKATSDRMLTLGELCDLVAGKVPLYVEIKSRFGGDTALTRRTVDIVRGYAGPVAVMSFDPDVIRGVRAQAPGMVRGIVAERRYDHAEWTALPAEMKRNLAHLLHAGETRPHFVAYAVRDLPAPATLVARRIGVPILTWTVRTAEDRARAAKHADQIIFEGFRA